MSPWPTTSQPCDAVHPADREHAGDLVAQLERNNRSYVTVGIGCTGGQHRSVFIAELASAFRLLGKNVQIRHRTLDKRSNPA
jgi:UPF0042 nucleotide-binding protein